VTFALDTNIVSYVLKGLYNLENKITAVFEDENLIVIPPISFYEIVRGLYANNAYKRLELFSRIFQEFVQTRMERADWIQAARLYADCIRTGHPMADDDLLQAAFCLRHGYVLVTHNVKHFEHIAQLPFEDWV
jgi:tRNA(fMet)-specific endonuclease VapC